MSVTDPVCGKQFDIELAAAHEDHGGWAYFFCSKDCHRLFKQTPALYSENLGVARGDVRQTRRDKC